MNLALCCISLALKEQGHSFQTMTYTRFKSLPYDEALPILAARIYNNFVVTGKTIQECYNKDIKGYRLSSNIVPLINHPEINLKLSDLPNYDKIKEQINVIKHIIKTTGVRVSAHPSEYISLTSDNNNVINNSIRDLEQHGEIFDLLELPKTHWSPLNIHCRQEGEPIEVFQKFAKNYARLSNSIKSRLVIEINDNKRGVWHVTNLIKYFYDLLGLPVTFDTLHHKFCNDGLTEEQAFKAAYATWDTIPLFHYSEGIGETRNHADFPTSIPNDYGKQVYWDIELKAKNFAIKKIMEMASNKTRSS